MVDLPRPGDHPRSRGEYACAMTPHSRQEGSSPLSRGIPCYTRRQQVKLRDHPRSRGEYAEVSIPPELLGGSSPLSRGILHTAAHSPCRARIIPALAGNTRSMPRSRAILADHPRSRGEYSRKPGTARSCGGSSPLSRGIHPIRLVQPLQPGIIPALAGNTAAYRRFRTGWGDHPRSRGEYTIRCKRHHIVYGSSPLSRGIPLLAERFQRLGGIIPALAGNTLGDDKNSWWIQDHPRSRGEYYIAFPN